jgi:hypothetical protein
MFNKYILLILFLIIKISQSLKSTDLCFMKQKKCTGNYDKIKNEYSTNCEKIKCYGKYKHECMKDKCSISKVSCDNYMNFNIYLSVQAFKSEFDKYVFPSSRTFYKVQDKKLKIFNKQIAECPWKSNVFDSNHICNNGKNCTEKSKLLKGFGYNYYHKPIDCICQGNYNYKCGKNFCTIDSNVCDKFTSIKTVNKVSFINFKDCDNGNRAFLKTISIFS